jgi:hypothetical protein
MFSAASWPNRVKCDGFTVPLLISALGLALTPYGSTSINTVMAKNVLFEGLVDLSQPILELPTKNPHSGGRE